MELDDQRHYDTAQGWLELGNLAEAEAALDRISPGVCEQPAVLEMRFHICAQTDRWDEAHELGKDFLFIEPDSLNAPALVARALHRLGRSAEAYELLKPVCDAFPGESGPPYNLACICCALDRVEEAREWLAKALEIGGKELKLRALEDEELAAIW